MLAEFRAIVRGLVARPRHPGGEVARRRLHVRRHRGPAGRRDGARPHRADGERQHRAAAAHRHRRRARSSCSRATTSSAWRSTSRRGCATPPGRARSSPTTRSSPRWATASPSCPLGERPIPGIVTPVVGVAGGAHARARGRPPAQLRGVTRAMTDSFVVRAGRPLHGTVRVSGATKNAGTKQMAAALLAPGVTTLRNVDPVADLDVMIDVLRAIGAGVEWTGPAELQIDAVGAAARRRRPTSSSRACARRSTCSGRCWRAAARRASPCPAATTSAAASSTCTSAGSSRWASSSTSCTASSRRAPTACPAPGSCSSSRASAPPRTCSPRRCWPRARPSSRTRPASRRSPISPTMLNRMGAEIHGAGTSTIAVEGVEELAPVESEIMGDRIETGTLLMACGIAGGEVTLLGARLDHVEIVVDEAHRDGPAGVADARRALGARRRAHRARSTSPRCRSPASPPTSCRSRSRCSPPPTAPPSSPRTCSTTGSGSSPSSTAWAPTSATRVVTR